MANRVLMDSVDGVDTVAAYEDGKLHIQQVQSAQQVQSVLDLNHAHRIEGGNRKAANRLGARVPTTLNAKWHKEWRENHSDKWEWLTYVAMKLNNPEYKYLRTMDSLL